MDEDQRKQLPQELIIMDLATTSPEAAKIHYHGPIYIYGNRWGQYTTGPDYLPDGTTPADSINLCGVGHWSGYVEPQKMYLAMTAQYGQMWFDFQYRADKSKTMHPVFPAPEFFRKCPAAGSRLSPETQALQLTTAARAGVDGEVLLALRLSVLQDPSSAPDDVQMWACVVTSGFPELELIEQPDGKTQSVHVWLDGTFQALVARGAVYAWRLRPANTNCGVPDMPISGDHRFTVPPVAGPTAEKVLLACYVSGKTLSDCDQWWLTRP